MKNKLFVNANHFDTKKLKMIYMLSRIEQLAAKHLNFRTHEKFHFSFFSSKNMCVILKKFLRFQEKVNNRVTVGKRNGMTICFLLTCGMGN